MKFALIKSLCNGVLVESMVCTACSFTIYIAAYIYTFKPTLLLQVKNMQTTSQIIKIHIEVFLKCFKPLKNNNVALNLNRRSCLNKSYVQLWRFRDKNQRKPKTSFHF